MRPLSSQKRMKTVARIQATADWVTRSSSHDVVGGRGAVGLLGVFPLQVEGFVELGDFGAAPAEVIFEQAQLRLQVAEQRGAVDHDALLASAAKVEGTTSCSVSPGMTPTVSPSSLGGSCRSWRIGQSSHRPCGDSSSAARGADQAGEEFVAAGVPGQRGGVVEEDHSVGRTYPPVEPTPRLIDQAGEADPGAGGDGGGVGGEHGAPAGLALLIDDRVQGGDELRGDVDRGHAVELGYGRGDLRRRAHPRLDRDEAAALPGLVEP